MCRNRCNFASSAISFGIGLILSCFCPVGLVFFILGVIIISLGIMLSKRR